MINIQELIPFLEPCWLAMDRDGKWFRYEFEPILDEKCGIWLAQEGDSIMIDTDIFKDIAPANDWTKSLIKVG